MAASVQESSGAINICGYTVDILQELGRGGFGAVFKGYDEAKDAVAVKKVVIGNESEDRKKASSEAVKFHFLKDNVCNDHVIKVYDVKRWRDSMWIMMEFCDLGDLNKFFVKYYQKIDTNVKLNIMGQIAKGVAFLHHNNIVHRDIKPGNILLKCNSGYGIVKLGDFGLSKFLDPDDMTSAMSSNVGTLVFKAPEFWDRKPNDRVRYHRNVDVYAAGLTFTAMLQANPGRNLVPKAEGSLQSLETKMSIGFAALTRYLNKQSEIRVVVPDRYNDTPLVKEMKSIVEAMTCFSPEARLAAEEVEERMDSLARKFLRGKNLTTFPSQTGMTFISQFNIGEVKYPGNMCYINGNLVMATPRITDDTAIKVIHEETGSVLQEFDCCHMLPHFMVLKIKEKEYLLQGCIVCKIIRGYESPETSSSYKIFYEHIAPDAMCKGPNGTIFVLENNSIKQLSFSQDHFNLIETFSYQLEINNICYCEKYGIVVVLHNDRKSLTGVKLATGDVAWKHTIGSSAEVLGCIEDVFTIPDGRICILDLAKLFVLDPKDGTIKYKLFHSEGLGYIWGIATCINGLQQRFAIQHGGLEQTQISVYDLLTERYLRLQDIVYDEENLKTDD